MKHGDDEPLKRRRRLKKFSKIIKFEITQLPISFNQLCKEKVGGLWYKLERCTMLKHTFTK
jgi:hypothetical protein